MWCRHHVVKLGHARLDQGAQLACACNPHYLLVDINVFQILRFSCALAAPITVSVSPVSISSSVVSSLAFPPIPTCVAAPHSPALPLQLPPPLPLPRPALLPLPLALFLPLPVPLPVPVLISSIPSTQRADSSSLVSVSRPTPLLPVPIPPLGILGSVCVSVSITSISSLRVCLLTPCTRSVLCPPFQNLLSVPVLRLTRCASSSSPSVDGRGGARPPVMSLVSRLSTVLHVVCVTGSNRPKSERIIISLSTAPRRLSAASRPSTVSPSYGRPFAALLRGSTLECSCLSGLAERRARRRSRLQSCLLGWPLPPWMACGKGGPPASSPRWRGTRTAEPEV